MPSDASLPGRTERIRAPVIRAGPREDREDTPRGQPIEARLLRVRKASGPGGQGESPTGPVHLADRKSTRLNSSHGYISYAVFCLKKKKMKQSLCTLTMRRRRTREHTL